MDPKSRVISIDATDIATISINEPDGVVVIMPSINAEKARKTAEILLERSGVYTIIIVVNDSIRAGYISTLNATARQVNARYVAYVAEDAFPGLNWLSTAFERLEATGKGLLAFNCGKWRGRIAAFGLVRMSWIKPLYGGDIFFPGYKAHKADNEITVIARTQDQLVYEPDAVLVEVDPGKKFVETSVNDREIFRSRFRTGFDGKVPVSLLEPLAEAYFVKMHPVENERERGSTDATPSSGHPQRVTVQIPANSPLAARMVADAYQALSRGPYSVVDKTSLPPSGDAKDYWHPAPYWWPNPETRDGLPYIRRDGYRVPGTNLYEEGSERYDRSRIQRVFDDSAVLMLAYEVSKKAEFLDHAARILRVFFLDPSTAMNPHLKFGQVRMGHKNNQGNATAIIETKDLYFYLDAVRALIHSGGLTSAEERDFRAWLTAFLDWLLNSEQGRLERDAQNNHGICYDLQVGAIAAFLGLDEELALAARRAEGRLPQHFDVEGRQNNEINRTNSAHYCCFNMQSWVNMSEIAQRVGVDLWHTDVHGGINLGVGAKWLLTFMDRPWPFTQAEEFDRDRWLPILFAAQGAGVDGLPSPPPERRAPELVKPVFFPHDCIRPYWNVFTTTVRPSTPSGHQN